MSDGSEHGFRELLTSLARGESMEIAHFLTEHLEAKVIHGTHTSVRTHYVSSDANGAPAIELLSRAMAAAAIDYCIPRHRISEAMEHLVRTGSTSKFARLESQARELFVDADGSGEGGELLLFLLMERILRLPQIMTKMSLKTSSNVHFHGSDGVHARLSEDGVLDLFWGESKLHKTPSGAIMECFASVAPFLRADGAERRRDLLLLRDQLNVEQQSLAIHLLDYFDESHPSAVDVRWNAVCLIGFDYKNYPNSRALTEAHKTELEKAIERWQRLVGRRLADNDLAAISIDVYCVPFPSVDAFRKSVRAALGVKG
ncbi:DUF1837 domain-containing protein [Microbacterium sp.]|uniref:HamA C-terminal domain-containing protein n=1 Tax=Microbacterium sp. TaxID=51671 RepID=UPI0037355FAE